MNLEHGIQSNPYYIPMEQFLFSKVVKGDPVPASRPRVLRNGHVYYDRRYGDYRDALTWHLKNTLSPLPLEAFLDATIPPERRRYGLRVFFYRKSRQRSDVDNLLKAVLDGGTGILWLDDCQVEEVFARVFRSSSDPRIELLIYETEPPQPSMICRQCGTGFDTSPGKTKVFCSQACYDAAMLARRVEFSCKECSKKFLVLRCIVRQRTPGFCSQLCSVRYWAKQKVAEGSAKWRCRDCGAQVSRKEYKRCRSCQVKRRAGIEILPPGSLDLFVGEQG